MKALATVVNMAMTGFAQCLEVVHVVAMTFRPRREVVNQQPLSTTTSLAVECVTLHSQGALGVPIPTAVIRIIPPFWMAFRPHAYSAAFPRTVFGRTDTTRFHRKGVPTNRAENRNARRLCGILAFFAAILPGPTAKTAGVRSKWFAALLTDNGARLLTSKALPGAIGRGFLFVTPETSNSLPTDGACDRVGRHNKTLPTQGVRRFFSGAGLASEPGSSRQLIRLPLAQAVLYHKVAA